jgi:cytochrome c oxidase subunit 4
MKAARIILAAWATLLALLALTIAASFAPLGRVLPFVSYGIAIAKTAIVVWIFMELRVREGLQRIALAAGFAWLAVLFILLFADPLTRGWAP